MVTKPLDPEIPKQPGEPNSEVEPDLPIVEIPQPSNETPANSPENGDYISEIRQSLASEETSRSKRGTGSLIRRITGSLRRVTGPLRNTDELSRAKAEAAPEPSFPEGLDNLSTGKLDSEPTVEMTDELLSGRLEPVQEHEVTDDFITGRLSSEMAPEIPDDLFASRFGSTAPGDTPESWSDLHNSGSEAGELLEMEEEPVLGDAPGIGDDAPISLLESGAIAALGMTEEEISQGDEPDWMSEIRAETRNAVPDAAQNAAPTSEAGLETRPEQPSGEKTSLRGATGQLRKFITGILGHSKEKQSQPEETDFSDELVSDRLGRSLGTTETDGKPVPRFGEDDAFLLTDGERAFQPAGEGTLEEPFSAAFHETAIIDETGILNSQAASEKADFFEGLEVNFANVGEIEPSEGINGYELYPEDEALLWGTADQPAAETNPPDIPITPEDIWGNGSDTLGYGSDLRRDIWSEAAEPETSAQEFFPRVDMGKPEDQDAYAATFLTGTDFLPTIGAEPDTDNLLSQVLDETPAKEDSTSVQDLRSIALQDYEEGEESDYSDYTYKIDWGDEDKVTPVEAETETEKADSEKAKLWAEETEEETRQTLSTDWKSWFINRKTSHKILLVEAAVVVIAMLVALPYFLFMMLRGPLIPAAQAQQNALPAGVPYPTGLTLPGGWYFPLERSSFTNGKWQPSTSEWLEGSELRRVVALPWNPQTEAVIQTFQTGDTVELYLSNTDTLKYRVASIERLAVTNTQVYSDLNPSLAIILYQEKTPTRWVIICKP